MTTAFMNDDEDDAGTAPQPHLIDTNNDNQQQQPPAAFGNNNNNGSSSGQPAGSGAMSHARSSSGTGGFFGDSAQNSRPHSSGTAGNPLAARPMSDADGMSPRAGDDSMGINLVIDTGAGSGSGHDSGAVSTNPSGGHLAVGGAMSTRLNAARKAGGREARLKAAQGDGLSAMMMGRSMIGGGNDFGDGARSARSARPGSVSGLSQQAGGARRGSAVSNLGGIIANMPPDDGGGATLLVPASLDAPDQIFMPNMKREPYVPVRLARDKIKQALAEIAEHNEKHYRTINTMEEQYENLKAKLEAQVAKYCKKLTMHYNERVSKLDEQLKERLKSGVKGQQFAQLMADVDTWKARALAAEAELEQVRSELERERENAKVAVMRAQMQATQSNTFAPASAAGAGAAGGAAAAGGVNNIDSDDENYNLDDV